MGVTSELKLQIRLKVDVQLQSSNRIATDAVEFEKYAYKFPAGTIFENKTHKGSKGDDDCVENDGMHGWCYTTDGQHWQYCNFHAYILNYWPEYPELFEKVED